MRVARLPGLVLMAAVRGLVSEGESVHQELERSDPACILIDLSPEELWGLKEYFSTPFSEPLVPLLGMEAALARALSRFGEVRMPSPAFVVALRWAAQKSREIVPLNPGEEEYSAMFLKNVGYLELVRRTRAERALARSPPSAATPEELVIAWDAKIHQGKGSARMLEERRRMMTEPLAKILAQERGSVAAAIVDVEHWEFVTTALGRAP